jgi:hypothetical protein
LSVRQLRTRPRVDDDEQVRARRPDLWRRGRRLVGDVFGRHDDRVGACQHAVGTPLGDDTVELPHVDVEADGAAVDAHGSVDQDAWQHQLLLAKTRTTRPCAAPPRCRDDGGAV